VGAEILLEVQVRHLLTLGRLEEILELLIKHNHATVVGVLEVVVFHVLVHRASDEASGDELPLWEIEEGAKFLGNLLFAVESVILCAVRRLLTGGVILRRLDLTNNLGERLDVIADGGDFSENGFGRHYTYYGRNIFKYIKSIKPSTIDTIESLVKKRILYIFPVPYGSRGSTFSV